MTNSYLKKLARDIVARYRRGFTLIETLVAVLILTVSIAGPLTIASKGMQAALVAKDQTTAYYLAQDAVEYVRWVRDSNALYNALNPGSPVGWLAGLDSTNNTHTNGGVSGGGCIAPNLCTVDSLRDTASQCVNGTCPVLNYDTSSDQFSYTSGSPSIYTRTVSITTPISGNSGEAQVVVKVYWQDSTATHPPITVYENLYNWQ